MLSDIILYFSSLYSESTQQLQNIVKREIFGNRGDLFLGYIFYFIVNYLKPVFLTWFQMFPMASHSPHVIPAAVGGGAPALLN